MNLLVATRNAHKMRELRQMLRFPGLTLVSADEIPGLPVDIVEDADTFEGNAKIKARALCRASGRWTLADDSGLEVIALNNAPGVHSARYAGEPSDTKANNAKLLAALHGIADRRARFVCVLALCAPDGREWTVRGECNGRILDAAKGAEGFGYDPLFVPDGYDRTFAELGDTVKNTLSHRANALRAACAAWAGFLGETRLP